MIERTLGFRDYVGDYQRQLFLIDHAGLPLKTVLEQLDLLGEEVVPVLRKEFAIGRPEHVPDARLTSRCLRRPRPRHVLPEPEQEQEQERRRTLAIVSGGVREPSSTRLLADRLGEAVHQELTRAGDSSAARSSSCAGWATDHGRDAHRLRHLRSRSRIRDSRAADGLIAVTPAFNASFSGLFKSFFDVLPEGTVSDMPVLIAATGGTERHSLVLEHALRPMFSYLHAVVSPTGVYAATDDFGAGRRPAGWRSGSGRRPPTSPGSSARAAPRATGRLRRAAHRDGKPSASGAIGPRAPMIRQAGATCSGSAGDVLRSKEGGPSS